MKYGMMLFLLVALLSGGAVSAAAPDAPSVILSMTEDSNITELNKKWIEQYTARNPHMQINLTGPAFGQLDPLILRMGSGAGVPDIISLSSMNISTLARLDLLDLTPYIEKYMTAADIADFHPQQWGIATRNGHQYGIPRYMGCVATVYNQDLFQASGVREPDRSAFSWDEMAAVAKKLTLDKNGDGANDQWGYHVPWSWNRMAHWAWQNGADFYAPGKPEKPTISNPEFIEAWTTLARYRWESNIMPTPAQAGASNGRAVFSSGKLAMFEEGNWAIPGIVAPMVNGAFSIGMAELPYKKTRSTYHTTDIYAIWAGTKHPEEAFKFLLWLTSPEVNRSQIEEFGLPPARLSQISYYEWWFRKSNYDMSATRFLWSYARPTLDLSTEWTTAINDVIRTSVQQNKVPVASALQDAARRIEASYK